MSNKGPRIYIVRHAHRDVGFDRFEDNGLSERGRSQALKFAEEFIHKILNKSGLQSVADIRSQVSVSVWSSPRARCRETVEPLAHLLGVPVQVDNLLEERRLEESHEDFMDRLAKAHSKIDGYIQSMVVPEQQAQGQTIRPFLLLCSHGDWIPQFTEAFCKKAISLEKGDHKRIRLR